MQQLVAMCYKSMYAGHREAESSKEGYEINDDTNKLF